MKTQFSVIGIFNQFLHRYEDAVVKSRGRITLDCEYIGYAIEFMAVRYAQSIGELGLISLDKCLKTLRDTLKRQEDWLMFSILCAYYPLDPSTYKISLPLANLDHHNSSLRDYALNCVYFVGGLFPFGDRSIRYRTENNATNGNLCYDKNLWVANMGKGENSQKWEYFKQLYDKVDSDLWGREAILPYTKESYIPNPFEEIDRYAMTTLLDFMFNKLKADDDQYLIDCVSKARDNEDLKHE